MIWTNKAATVAFVKMENLMSVRKFSSISSSSFSDNDKFHGFSRGCPQVETQCILYYLLLHVIYEGLVLRTYNNHLSILCYSVFIKVESCLNGCKASLENFQLWYNMTNEGNVSRSFLLNNRHKTKYYIKTTISLWRAKKFW